MDVREEHILGEKIHSHWYYVSKGRAMRKFLGNMKVPEVLDVGAGTGIFSRQLLDEGLCDSAVCVDPFYTEEKTETYHNKPLSFVKKVDTCPQNLILMMDVLEHVTDDLGLLKEYADRMQSGGHIFITVPAFQFMWSSHDVFLGHYRRYTAGSLDKIVRQADMTPIKSRYFFASFFPLLAPLRIVNKFLFERGVLEAKSHAKLYSDRVNRMFTIVHDIERRTFFPINNLFWSEYFIPVPEKLTLCR